MPHDCEWHRLGVGLWVSRYSHSLRKNGSRQHMPVRAERLPALNRPSEASMKRTAVVLGAIGAIFSRRKSRLHDHAHGSAQFGKVTFPTSCNRPSRRQFEAGCRHAAFVLLSRDRESVSSGDRGRSAMRHGLLGSRREPAAEPAGAALARRQFETRAGGDRKRQGCCVNPARARLARSARSRLQGLRQGPEHDSAASATRRRWRRSRRNIRTTRKRPSSMPWRCSRRSTTPTRPTGVSLPPAQSSRRSSASSPIILASRTTSSTPTISSRSPSAACRRPTNMLRSRRRHRTRSTCRRTSTRSLASGRNRSARTRRRSPRRATTRRKTSPARPFPRSRTPRTSWPMPTCSSVRTARQSASSASLP